MTSYNCFNIVLRSVTAVKNYFYNSSNGTKPITTVDTNVRIIVRKCFFTIFLYNLTEPKLPNTWHIHMTWQYMHSGTFHGHVKMQISNFRQVVGSILHLETIFVQHSLRSLIHTCTCCGKSEWYFVAFTLYLGKYVVRL